MDKRAEPFLPGSKGGSQMCWGSKGNVKPQVSGDTKQQAVSSPPPRVHLRKLFLKSLEGRRLGEAQIPGLGTGEDKGQFGQGETLPLRPPQN